MDKLEQALKDKKIAIEVKAWTFVTPDDLPVEIINFILEETAKKSWKGGALTAMVLAPLFSKYPVIQIDFPSITAGLQFDKTPSVDVNIALNDGYHVLELFNDGTEDIKSIRVAKKVGKEGWVPLTHNFLFEHDNFAMNGGHSLYNLKKGERQYCRSIPTQQPFQYSVSGVGVESSKTLVKEGCIDPLSLEK